MQGGAAKVSRGNCSEIIERRDFRFLDIKSRTETNITAKMSFQGHTLQDINIFLNGSAYFCRYNVAADVEANSAINIRDFRKWFVQENLH